MSKSKRNKNKSKAVHSTPISKVNKPSDEHAATTNTSIPSAFSLDTFPELTNNIFDVRQFFQNICTKINHEYNLLFSFAKDNINLPIFFQDKPKEMSSIIDMINKFADNINSDFHKVLENRSKILLQALFIEESYSNKNCSCPNSTSNNMQDNSIISQNSDTIVQPSSLTLNSISAIETSVQDSFTQTEDIKTDSDYHSINSTVSSNDLPLISDESLKMLNISCNSQNISNSNNFHSVTNVTKNSSLSKIMIYNVPKDIPLAYILESITDSVNDPITNFTLIKTFSRKNSNGSNLLCQLNNNVANSLISQRKVKILSKSYAVEKFISIKRCYNCQSIGHLARSCKFKLSCAICGEQHKSNECQNQPKCVNCCAYNKLYHRNFNTQHTAYSSDCKVYKLQFLQKRKVFSLSMLNNNTSCNVFSLNKSLPVFPNPFNLSHI